MTEILLKVALNTLTLAPTVWILFLGVDHIMVMVAVHCE